jgi:squalene synthase HpnC
VVVADAYARCLAIARGHYENFPVASRLVPGSIRPHIAAVYAFARAADDFADEGDHPQETRLARLADWRDRLQRAADGRDAVAADLDTTAVFVALADTMRRFELERSLFTDLLSAFEQDVTVTRYERWDDLLDYCRRSANPIGRLVLRLFGQRAAQLDAWSDAICTALQLANFWQDLAIDWQKGRLYAPRDLVARVGASEADLQRRRITPEWRAALSEASSRTRELFVAGRPLADAVSGRLRWELRLTWLGGMRILERLERLRFDVFQQRPTLQWPDALVITGRALTWAR